MQHLPKWHGLNRKVWHGQTEIARLKAHITLYDLNGAICSFFDITNDHLEIANKLDSNGVYVVKISVGELTESSKFIKL